MARQLHGKQIVDGSVTEDKLDSGAVTWKKPVAVKHLVGNAAETVIEGLTPTQGDAYVVSAVDGDSTIDGTAAAVGDIFEYDGAAFQKIVTNSGGFPPDGTRAILSTQTTLIAPYTDTSHDGQIRDFDGTSLTGTVSGDAVDGYTVAVKGDGGVFENSLLVFSGVVPTGTWAGGGNTSAGTGLTESPLDTLNVDADSETGGNIQPVNLTGNGVGVDIAAIAGVGVEADGSANLRLAAQGNGISGGAGSTLSVDPDSETGGNTQPVSVAANGVGLDVAAIAGTGLEADGSANLRVAAQGNGIAGGAGSTLSVDSDTETGGDIQGVNVTANGVGVDIAAIAGTGLEADGAANLRIDEDGATVNVTGGTWTYTPDTLQVSGTPDSDNDAVNKAYVDALAAAGATWRNPVRDSDLVDVVGANPGTGAAVAAAYGITTGDNVAFIATAGFTFDAGGATIVAVAGDIVNLTMTSPTAGDYTLIEAGPLTSGDRFIVGAEHGTAQGILDGALGQIDIGADDATVTAGSFVIGDTYRITTVGTTDFTLIGASASSVGVSFVATGIGAGTGDALDVTNNIKKADLVQFTGTGDGSTAASWSFPEGRSGLAAGETEIAQGITVLNNDPDSVHFGHTFLYNQDADGWVEISGPGAVGAGTGLSYTGNTLNVGDGGKGVQVNASDLVVDASEIVSSTGGLQQVAGGGNEHLLEIKAADTSVATAAAGLSAATPSTNNKNMTASVTASDDDAATAATVTAASAAGSRFDLYVNGLLEDLREDKNGSAFLSNDGGTTAAAFSAVVGGSTIHWVGSNALYQLAASDILDLHANV
jgi:hypothetical protein